MFQVFSNFEICIREAFRIDDEDRVNERKLLNLRQDGSVSVYVAKFQTLVYKGDWDESALVVYFYKGLNDRVKDVMVTVATSGTLADMINIVTKIDNR